MFDSIRHITRLAQVARMLAQYDALAPRELAHHIPGSVRFAGRLARAWPGQQGSHIGRTTRPGERLGLALQSLGPAFIKLGQFLATRPDIIGIELTKDLKSLQDRLPPFPTTQTKAIIATELERPWDELYATLSEPMAAASIAQVHKAETLPLDDEVGAAKTVAVKVLRPGIEENFAKDMAALAFAAKWAERLRPALKRLEPVKLIETLAVSSKMEMDLRLEAAAASELAENNSGRKNFRVPEIDWTRTSQRILTLEWIDGTPLTDGATVKAQGFDPTNIARHVIETFLTHALKDGFFHADMHQGNIFIDPEGCLTAVDFGIMGRLDHDSRRYLAEILFGFLTRDYERLAEVHFTAGYVPAHHSRHDFAQSLRAVGEPIFGRHAGAISMARLLAQLFQVTETFDMHLQPQLVLLQKTMMVVEGVARDLDPDLNMWEVSRPVVEQWMVDNFSPQAQLREAAESAGALGRSLKHLPAIFTAAETLPSILTPHGLRLHPDAARAIAKATHRQRRGANTALWIGAVALAVIALSVLV